MRRHNSGLPVTIPRINGVRSSSSLAQHPIYASGVSLSDVVASARSALGEDGFRTAAMSLAAAAAVGVCWATTSLFRSSTPAGRASRRARRGTVPADRAAARRQRRRARRARLLAEARRGRSDDLLVNVSSPVPATPAPGARPPRRSALADGVSPDAQGQTPPPTEEAPRPARARRADGARPSARAALVLETAADDENAASAANAPALAAARAGPSAKGGDLTCGADPKCARSPPAAYGSDSEREADDELGERLIELVQDAEDIGELLSLVGLEKYEKVFRREEIDLPALQLLTEQHLKELPIPIGPRVKLLEIVDALKEDRRGGADP
jgi:hypothetical protein